MKPYIIQLFQYVLGDRANIEDKVQSDSKNHLSEAILIKKRNKKLAEISEFFSDAKIDDLRPFLRAIKNIHLETILFKNITDPISPEYIIPSTKMINDELDKFDEKYNLIKDEKSLISEENRLMFHNYFLMAKLISEKIEKNNTDSNNIPFLLAYKMLTLFGNNPKNPFEPIEKYLIKFNYYNVYNKPLNKALSECELRNNTSSIHLKEWRALVQANHKAIKFFPVAAQIEKQLLGKLPTNFNEVREIAKTILFTRAKEYPASADLFLESGLDEKAFDHSLEIEKRRKKKDNLPAVTIQGIDVDPSLTQYRLRKLPIDDPRAYVLGELTNCCQSMSGYAERCVIDGITLENNGFYILEKVTTNAQNIVGQGYAWISQKGTLVFDSWENLTPSHEDKVIFKFLQNFSKVICDQKDSSIFRVTIGTGGKTPPEFKTKEQEFPDLMKEGYPFCDAKEQFLIYSNEARKDLLLTEIKKTIITSYCDEKNSESFSSYLNWVKDSISSQKDADEANNWLEQTKNVLKIKSLIPDIFKKSFISVRGMLDEIENAVAAGIFYPDEINLIALIRSAYNGPAPYFKREPIEDPLEALFIHGMFNKNILKKMINSKRYNFDKLLARQRQSLLTLAAINKKDDAISQLISARCCNLDYQTDFGCTALIITISEESYESAKALINAGVNVTLVNCNKKTALDYAIAAKNPDLYIISYLVTHGCKGNINFQDKAGNSLLMHAAVNNNSEIVSELIKLTCNLDLQNSDEGDTALILAIWKNNVSIARALIKAGANVNITNKRGIMALEYAIEGGNLAIIDDLIAHGAVISKSNDEKPSFEWDKRLKHKDVVKKIIASKIYNFNLKDKKGDTGLTWAIKWGDIDTVRDLIESNQCDINLQGADGSNAVSLSMLKNDDKILQMLIAAGLDINKTDEKGQTLWDRITKDNFRSFQELIMLLKCGAKGNINFQCTKGYSILLDAVNNNDLETVSKLISLHCNLDLQNVKDRDTALILAVWHKNQIIVQKLIEAGADLNLENIEEKTALDFAIEKKYPDIVNLLLTNNARGAKSNSNPKFEWEKRLYDGDIVKKLILSKNYNFNLKDKNGDTALTWVIKKGDIQIACDLIESKQCDIYLENQKADTPISLSMEKREDTVLKKLIAVNGDIDKPDARGQTLGDKLFSFYTPDFTKLTRLILYGFKTNINFQFCNGETVLINAAKANQHEVVSKLITLQCNLNLKDTVDGDCALIHAIWNNNDNIAKLLIEAGADLNITNNLGRTALYYAIQKSNIPLIELLIKHDAKDHLLNSNETCLIWAMQNNHNGIAFKIIESPNCNLDLFIKDNDTALTLAAENENEEIAIKLIQSKRCNLNLQTQLGDTALTNAAENNHKTIAHALIESKDCDLNLQTKIGETALTLATIDNYKEIAQELIDSKRCNLSLKNLSGNTALIIAAQKNYREIAASLILAEAKLDFVNNEGKSAIDYAIENKNLYIINLLLTNKVQVKNLKEFLIFLNSCDKQDPNFELCLNAIDQQKNPADAKNSGTDGKISQNGLFSPKPQQKLDTTNMPIFVKTA